MRVYLKICTSSWSISHLALPFRKVQILPPPLTPPPPYLLLAATRSRRNLALFAPTHFYSSRISIITIEEAPSPASMGSQATDIEWPAKRVRETFIKYFEDRGHVCWKSSPVVPHNDPTLLFANAGNFSLLISYFSVFFFPIFVI